MTLETTRPETEARIQRHLQSGQFNDLDDLLTKALDALPEPETAATRPERRTGQELIDAFAETRGLLSDEEIDRMFSRNPSAARPVDLS
jgi:Arc/MetJ-type ribon-helix-helix transcriptional regulator